MKPLMEWMNSIKQIAELALVRNVFHLYSLRTTAFLICAARLQAEQQNNYSCYSPALGASTPLL